ncbi:helix-turn-helix transcriptional regulator [Clostridium cadaveris]|uniref:helix-turn-helix domain-containing protein n=1 Tax=Clostridium cadaveris TaxID=1529 RepID=UPI00145967FD|nr:helix-turn-helix transcriptional regulator [Clostridium cadaveris]NME64069.1 helix-turn-helix transcriptional regulator [Clostridium cadaveris]
MSELFDQLSWYKKIEVLRTIKGWSQNEASERCFTGQKSYWEWENGVSYPRKNSRRAISQAFEVSEEEIFGKESY